MKKMLDARTLDCPKPVIETQKALKDGAVTELEVWVGNVTAKENLKRFAETGGYEYSITEREDGFAIVIYKQAWESVSAESTEKTQEIQSPENSQGKTYLILSDKLGKGDDELGKVLIKGFLYTLTQTEPFPKKILLLNSAVKLSTENIETLEHLQTLKEKGVEIYSCGTCLNFYGLAEELKVGEIGNMYDVVESLSKGDCVTIA